MTSVGRLFRFDRMRTETRIALQRFRILFRHADRAEVSARLGVGEKQVQRYFSGESEPTAPVMARIREMVEEAKDDAVVVSALEQLRAEAEREQRRVPLLEIDGLEEKEIPGWFADVRADLAAGRFDDALLVLRQRRKYKDDWDRVPSRTKPYVLGSLGIAEYYKARWSDAEAAFREALGTARTLRNDTPALFLAIYTSNLGLSLMRQVRYEEAFLAFNEAAAILPAFLATYYNALCAASLMESGEWVGHWAGRLIEATPQASKADIIEVLSTIETDKDLVFARNCDSVALMIGTLRAIDLSKR